MFCLVFWLHCEVSGILVPPAEIEPKPPAVEVQSPNHWTTSSHRLDPPSSFPQHGSPGSILSLLTAPELLPQLLLLLLKQPSDFITVAQEHSMTPYFLTRMKPHMKPFFRFPRPLSPSGLLVSGEDASRLYTCSQHVCFY